MQKRCFLCFLLLSTVTLCFCQDLLKIPGTKYKMLKTEVTQKMYKEVMGENPSHFKGKKLPVELISWYDMTGNVCEWCWDSGDRLDGRPCCGGSCIDSDERCKIERIYNCYPVSIGYNIGIRVVCSSANNY